MLTEKKYKKIYRTFTDDIINDFYQPSFNNCTLFYRGVSFFSLASIANLIHIDSGFINFIKNGGVLKIITSPHYSENDQNFIVKNKVKLENFSKKIIQSELEKQLESNLLNKMDIIANLIELNRLEIRIAFLENGGLYHEKIGFFADKNDNYVYFTGSNNQTINSSSKNMESLFVTTSWDDFEMIKDEFNYFNDIWEGNIEGINSYSFLEAWKNSIIIQYKKSNNLEKAINKYAPRLNKNVKVLRAYQNEAIDNFLKNKNYFFEMATGTGKTFTTVSALKEILKKENQMILLILVPSIALLKQWYKDLKILKIQIFKFCGESKVSLTDCLMRVKLIGDSVAILSTYDTYFSKLSKDFNNKVNYNKLTIIVDEAHNLTYENVNKLPSKTNYRLGLSATPYRFKKNETNKIFDYFGIGDIPSFKYSIEEAIKNKFLSHYNYYPIFSYLSESDTIKYKELTKKLIVAYNSEPIDDQVIEKLLNNRSLIIKKSPNKLIKLQELIDEDVSLFHNSVVYCGQGINLETKESIIDEVSTIIGQKCRVQQYISRKPSIEREKILNDFYANDLDSLISIRCLDEGIDIPKLSKIFILSSDSSIRQTIQRRGRVLRICNELGEKIALIYDFIVLPYSSCCENGKNIVVTELRRFKEYNRIADNKDMNNKILNELENQYCISEEDYVSEKKILGDNDGE